MLRQQYKSFEPEWPSLLCLKESGLDELWMAALGQYGPAVERNQSEEITRTRLTETTISHVGITPHRRDGIQALGNASVAQPTRAHPCARSEAFRTDPRKT